MPVDGVLVRQSGKYFYDYGVKSHPCGWQEIIFPNDEFYTDDKTFKNFSITVQPTVDGYFAEAEKLSKRERSQLYAGGGICYNPLIELLGDIASSAPLCRFALPEYILRGLQKMRTRIDAARTYMH